MCRNTKQWTRKHHRAEYNNNDTNELSGEIHDSITRPAYFHRAFAATRCSISTSLKRPPSRSTYRTTLNSLLTPRISPALLFIVRASWCLIKKVVEDARRRTGGGRQSTTGPPVGRLEFTTF